MFVAAIEGLAGAHALGLGHDQPAVAALEHGLGLPEAPVLGLAPEAGPRLEAAPRATRPPDAEDDEDQQEQVAHVGAGGKSGTLKF